MQFLRSLLIGLGAASLTAGTTMAAAAEAPAVVASIKPIHSLLAGVMEGVGRPTLLVQGGASPHAYSLRPSEARALQNADLVVWVGPEIESFLEQPLHALADDAYVLELSRAEGATLLPMREGAAWGEHDHGHGGEEAHEDHDDEDGHKDHDDEDAHAGHDDEDGHKDHDDEDAHVHREDGHEHGHGEFNLHLWLDPVNAGVLVTAMADALAQVDPERAAHYQDNAAALHTRLQALDAELKQTLAPVADRGFVVFHDAWQYFDTHYGLRAIGSITVNPEQAPSAARLVEIREALAGSGAHCVFAEPQFEPRLVQTLVAETGAASGTLDPLGAAIEAGPDLYFTLMRNNAASFRACFGE